MPAQKTQSPLMKKLGNRLNTAVNTHKNDETRVSTAGELPVMDYGIAQLSDVKIGYYKPGTKLAGEPFFMAAAIVVSPKSVLLDDGSKRVVEGLRTQLGPEPICDTKTSKGKEVSLDEHVDRILNWLRIMGVDTSQFSSGDDIESCIPALLEAAPYIQFRTWKGKATDEYPEPMLNHDWRGVVDYVAGDDDSVQDNTATAAKNGKPKESEPPFGDKLDDLVGDASGDDEKAADKAQQNLTKQAGALGYTKEQVDNSESWAEVAEWIRSGKGPEDGDASDSAGDEVDLDALGAEADEGNQESADKLSELAEAVSLDPNDYGTWAELATAIAEANDGEAAGDGAVVPAVGEIWLYKAEGAKKATEHEVTSVNEKSETVTLKSVQTMKPIIDPRNKRPINILWTDLETA